MKAPVRWEVASEELLADCKVFKVFRNRCRHPLDGREGDFFLLRAVNWAMCVAVTSDGKFILEQQYRHGIRELSWEFPGGVCEKGENPIDTAVRELREETGFVGDAPILLGTRSTNPALLNNRCSTVLIKNCRKVCDTKLDANEEILVREVSLEELMKMARDGSIHHALMLTAIAEVYLHAPEVFGGKSA